jgi:hypothetical protein
VLQQSSFVEWSVRSPALAFAPLSRYWPCMPLATADGKSPRLSPANGPIRHGVTRDQWAVAGTGVMAVTFDRQRRPTQSASRLKHFGVLLVDRSSEMQTRLNCLPMSIVENTDRSAIKLSYPRFVTRDSAASGNGNKDWTALNSPQSSSSTRSKGRTVYWYHRPVPPVSALYSVRIIEAVFSRPISVPKPHDTRHFSTLVCMYGIHQTSASKVIRCIRTPLQLPNL